MKIRTNIKAGEMPRNHNEKFASDNCDSIEQKKTIVKKLSLKKETIRELRESDLKGIAGGALNNSFTVCYASGCCEPTQKHTCVCF